MNIQALMMLVGLLVFATTGFSWAAEAVDISTGALAAVADPGIWGSVEAILDKLISILSNPLMAKIVTIVLGLLGGGKWLKNRAVQRWAELAFSTVEEMARTHQGNQKLDKIAAFSEVFQGYMKRAGWSKLVTKDDITQAHAIAKAVNIIAVKGEAFLRDKKPQ